MRPEKQIIILGGRCPLDHKTGEKMYNEEDKKEMLEISEPESSGTLVKRLSKGRYNLIKVWLIIGCIFTPFMTAFYFLGLGIASFIVMMILLYAITISICVATLSALKKTDKKSAVISYGVVCLIFVNFLGGIFILTIRDRDFIEVSAPAEEEQGEDEEKVIPGALLLEKTFDCDAAREEFLRLSGLQKNKVNAAKNISDELRSSVLSEISALEASVQNIDSELAFNELKYKLYSAKGKIDEIRKRKTNRIIAIVGAVLGVCIVAGIAISIARREEAQKAEEIAAEIKRENDYIELQALVNDYKLENDRKILELFDSLEGYYDLILLKRDRNNAYGYASLLNLIGEYDGMWNSEMNAESYLSIIERGYKERDKIENDLKASEEYVRIINSFAKEGIYGDGRDVLNLIDNRSAERVRTLIAELYEKANTSGLMNYDTFIRSLKLPFILYNAKFENGEYYFNWYFDEAENFLYNIPFTPNYDKNEEWYYKYFDYIFSENTVFYVLTSPSHSIVGQYLLRVNYAFFDQNAGKLAVNVYVYSTDSTMDMYLE